MNTLFTAIRGASNSGTWSQGVELVRADAVALESRDKDETILRVAERGGMLSRQVVLYLEDEDWSCECDSVEDACAHVAASIIFLRQGGKAATCRTQATSTAPKAGRIAYAWVTEKGALALYRDIVVGDQRERLNDTLARLATQDTAGPRFMATQDDLQIEVLLGTRRQGVLSQEACAKILEKLVDHPLVSLDGRSIAVGSAISGLHIVVRDRPYGDGFLLEIKQSNEVRKTFNNGALLCDGSLHARIHPPLQPQEVDTLRRGQLFRDDEVVQLVSQVLPRLRQYLPIEVQTRRLPELKRGIPPQLSINTSTRGQTLHVLATLVYGEPAIARVDGDSLRLLQGSQVPERNIRAEEKLVRQLEEGLGIHIGHTTEFSGEAGVTFSNKLQEWTAHGPDDRVQWAGPETAFRQTTPLIPTVSLEGSDFHIAFQASQPGKPGASGSLNADPQAVIRAWEQGASLVPLTDGIWAPLPAAWLAQHGQRVRDLLMAKAENDGQLPTAALPDLRQLCEDLDLPPPPAFEDLAQLVRGFEQLPDAVLPDDVNATLRDYQRAGVNWLSFMQKAKLGALLADDMGLGKTLQTLCVLQGRCLVVAPTSVLHNWQEEARKFRPGLKTQIYHGRLRQLDSGANVVITSYAILRLDQAVLDKIAWDMVVLDEAQHIKNPTSQVAQAAYAIPAGFHLALTGTPVENRLDELWSQFHFTNRGFLGGRSDFKKRYSQPIEQGNDAVAQHLQTRIKPFVLRRLKANVATELPPRTDIVQHCALNESERAIYDTVRAASVDKVVEKLQSGGKVLEALEALLRLRQAACHPSLVPGQHAPSSTKVNVLLEALEEIAAEGNKALVFSQWTGFLDLVEPHLESASIPYLRLDGSTRDRQGVVDAFQDDQGPPVLLTSLKAGGTGLNLTAADHVFLLDPWWNPAVEDQAADRAHRIGQTKPVFVHKLVSEGTVEEGIVKLQEKKRAIAEAALGGGSGALSLTRQDLLDLLE